MATGATSAAATGRATLACPCPLSGSTFPALPVPLRVPVPRRAPGVSCLGRASSGIAGRAPSSFIGRTCHRDTFITPSGSVGCTPPPTCPIIHHAVTAMTRFSAGASPGTLGCGSARSGAGARATACSRRRRRGTRRVSPPTASLIGGAHRAGAARAGTGTRPTVRRARSRRRVSPTLGLCYRRPPTARPTKEAAPRTSLPTGPTGSPRTGAPFHQGRVGTGGSVIAALFLFPLRYSAEEREQHPLIPPAVADPLRRSPHGALAHGLYP